MFNIDTTSELEQQSSYINRQTILSILQAIEPYITLDLEAVLQEVAQFDHNCGDLHEIWQVIEVPNKKRGPFAMLTLVAEDLINGQSALASSPSPFMERGLGGEVNSPNGSNDADSPSLQAQRSGEGLGEGSTTLHFTYIERGESTGSQSPKWEFRTPTGERYWAFEHKDEKRNTIPLFTLNGYHELRDMQSGDCLRWNKYPITVECVKDDEGKFWKAQKVTLRPADARPDSTLLDVITSSRKRAALKDIAEFAQGTEHDGTQIVIIDTETTGTGTADEIVEFAAFNLATGEVYETLINTYDNSRINALTHLHGITEEMLNAAPPFSEVAPKIEEFLSGKTIVAYNRDFDLRMLRQTWQQNELPHPIEWNEEVIDDDIMHLMAVAIGDPGKYGDAKYISLQEVAELCQLPTRQTHRAFADVRLTHEVIKAATAVYEQVKDIQFIPPDMDDIPF